MVWLWQDCLRGRSDWSKLESFGFDQISSISSRRIEPDSVSFNTREVIFNSDCSSDLLAANASGWLNSLGLLVVVEDASLASDVLHALTVDVVDSGDVVGDVCVVLVLVGDDSLCVQVVAVDGGDDVLVVSGVMVVLSHDGLHILVEGVDLSVLGWQSD